MTMIVCVSLCCGSRFQEEVRSSLHRGAARCQLSNGQPDLSCNGLGQSSAGASHVELSGRDQKRELQLISVTILYKVNVAMVTIQAWSVNFMQEVTS